jgi:DNA polymerase III gamma/tau subunit
LLKISRKILNGAADNARIPNAYLFVGTDDQSLLNEALSFACTLNDEKDASKASINPDIYVLQGENRSIKIAEVRDITDFSKFGPVKSKYKIVIVGRCDTMTEDAANAFLKTLEEPVANVLFILTTKRESKVLKTVVSRCQKLYFTGTNPIDDEASMEVARSIFNSYQMDMNSLLMLSEDLSDMPDIEEKLSYSIPYLREQIGTSDLKKFMSIKIVISAVRAMQRNANKRLALDNMLLTLRGSLA